MRWKKAITGNFSHFNKLEFRKVNQEFSEYIVYVDESGDHGLKTIDPNYPVFVLAFCIFKTLDYVKTAVPLLQDFKFKHFGHD